MSHRSLRSRIRNIRNTVIRFLWNLKRPSGTANRRRMRRRGETVADIRIREAVAADIPRLAVVHVKAWAETYWDVKRPPTYEIREYQWKEQFKINDGSWFCYVAETARGELVGFIKGKRYQSKDLPGFAGEINKIYLLLGYQRLGLGSRMLCQAARRFLQMGISNMVLFGIPQNPTCAFHEAMGAGRLYARNGEFHGGFAWHDLHRLVSKCLPQPDTI